MPRKKKPRFTTLQLAVHFAGWLPLSILAWDFFTNNLTVNPIQEITQRLGRYGLYFLVLSLACTPLNTLFGWRELLKRRRALGLYSFMYVSLHLLTFAGLDYGFSLELLNEATLEKPFVLMGLTAFSILLPLAITSFTWWKKKMGAAWKRLHRLVYLAGIVVIIHYAWAKKGTLSTLSGDILQPLIFGTIVALLLIMRIPSVRKWISQVRHRPKLWKRKKKPSESSIREREVTTS